MEEMVKLLNWDVSPKVWVKLKVNTGLIKISYEKINEFICFYDQLDRSFLYEGRSFKQMYMTTFLQLLIDAGWNVMPAKVKHGWLEIDTVEDLKLYEKFSEEGKLDAFFKINE